MHQNDDAEGLNVVELRDIPEEQAKKEILEYIKGKDRVFSDEVADALRIDMSLVDTVLTKLWKEGVVTPD